jgi:rhodanese-related sulfurtransferase
VRVPQQDPLEVAERLRAGEADLVLLDCREPEELALAAVEGALHMPMAGIPARLDELDPAKTYAVLCHHGQRSYQVCAFLLQRGYARVVNVRGGIDAWSVRVDPSIPRY